METLRLHPRLPPARADLWSVKHMQLCLLGNVGQEAVWSAASMTVEVRQRAQ